MKQALAQFWAKYPALSHAIAGAIAIAVEAYYQVPVFHDTVLGLYGHFPSWAKQVVVVGVALVIWYKQHRPVWTPEQRAQNGGNGK